MTDKTNPTLPEICAFIDQGGGVGFEDKFVVYSTTPLPDRWHTILDQTEPPPSLVLAAAAVVKYLPIYLQKDYVKPGLLALPGSNSSIESSDPPESFHRPWFFINSSTKLWHAIAGKGSEVETLLTVLRRPWCVLELCCCDDVSLQAILDFAKAAMEIDPDGYEEAVNLLSYETSMENGSDDELLQCSNGKMAQLSDQSTILHSPHKFHTSIIQSSISSYNGFWLRLIHVCALELGISYSDIGLTLDGNLDDEALSQPSNQHLERLTTSDETGSTHTSEEREENDINPKQESLVLAYLDMYHDVGLEMNRRLSSEIIQQDLLVVQKIKKIIGLSNA
ncbi:hypothetical protein MMC09_002031 [Bachmanniomyces sp. S44760]|nr:hypothetical protein [Bachmanniomyces sp. S44760]